MFQYLSDIRGWHCLWNPINSNIWMALGATAALTLSVQDFEKFLIQWVHQIIVIISFFWYSTWQNFSLQSYSLNLPMIYIQHWPWLIMRNIEGKNMIMFGIASSGLRIVAFFDVLSSFSPSYPFCWYSLFQGHAKYIGLSSIALTLRHWNLLVFLGMLPKQ